MIKPLLCAAFVAFSAKSLATTVVTVNWSAAFDNGLALSDGTALAIGNELRLGVFDFAPATLYTDIQTLLGAGDIAGLATHFTPFDVANIGDAFPTSDLGSLPVNERAGLFEATGTQTVNTGSPLFGKQIFLWAFKTTGNNAPLANYSNVTQVGIFGSTLPAWFFPSDSGLSESTSVELTNLSNTAGTTQSGTERVPWGYFGTGTTPATGAPAFNLAFVPEPSSAALLALAAGTLLLRRRRRS